MSSMVALRCSSRDHDQIWSAADTSAAVASSCRSGAATAASDDHSSPGEIVRHGVSVPPQSNRTASTGTNDSGHMCGGIFEGDVLALSGLAVLDLDDAVDQALADDHDRRDS